MFDLPLSLISLPVRLIPHYELLLLRAFVGYVQTISSDIARASPQLVTPLVSRICHHSEPISSYVVTNPS
jgi:hypothetical protein